MKALTRSKTLFALFACWLVYALSASGIAVHAQNRAAVKAATATVSGRVTAKGKGQGGIVVGVRGARIGPELAPAYKATTDADGSYRITNIPPGTYAVLTMAGAYVSTDGTSSFEGKTLILREGENVEGIDFSIERGGVITGKVTQTDGRPVIEERVVAVSEENQRRWPVYGQTDDRGIYRIFGVPTGRYKISVGEGPDNFFGARRAGYPQTFYTDPNEPGEPKMVEISEGNEATNIDIVIGSVSKGFAVSGVIVDGDTGQPIVSRRIGLQRIISGGRQPFYGASAASNSRGEFRHDNLPPGQYALVLVPDLNSDMQGDPVSFEIADRDVTGLVFRATRGASVSGVIVGEGANQKAFAAKLPQMRVIGFNRGGGIYAATSTIGPDGSFRLAGLQAGPILFQLSAPGGRIEDFVISRVERDGVATPSIEIKAGEQVSNVKLVVVTGTGTISGKFKILNGPPPAGIRFSVRLQKAGEQGINLRPQEADARGHFLLNNVPAGTYDLFLVGFVPGQSRQRSPSARQTITVTEGAVTEVELELNLDPSPNE